MSELTLTLLRIGLLAMLWLFVFAVVGVLRRDLFGTRVSRRRGRGRVPAPAGMSPANAANAASAPAAPPAAPSQPGTRGRAVGPAGRGIPTVLVVTEGRLAGTAIPLTASGILIGRNPECSLVLDDDFSSGRHARVFPRDGQWWVEDLGSTNGTFLGAAKLTTAQQVGVGSTLRIGRTVLELQG